MSYLLHRLHGLVVVLGLALAALPGLVIQAIAEPLDVKAALVDRVLGNPAAPVTMDDFSSLTCPHCADFHTETLPLLITKYVDTGKMKVVFHDFPLDQYALRAAMMTRCADPDHYFGFLGVLFKDQKQWVHASNPQQALAQIGALGGLSAADFSACMANKELSDAIIARTQEAQKKFDVRSTPTFVFNNGAKKLEGALPIGKFTDVIDGLLSH
jgi:protein-disulfide isomerase